MVMEVAEQRRQLVRPGARQAGAAEHQADAVILHVVGDPAPEAIDDRA
jgi:hypothetical protein